MAALQRFPVGFAGLWLDTCHSRTPADLRVSNHLRPRSPSSGRLTSIRQRVAIRWGSLGVDGSSLLIPALRRSSHSSSLLDSGGWVSVGVLGPGAIGAGFERNDEVLPLLDALQPALVDESCQGVPCRLALAEPAYRTFPAASLPETRLTKRSSPPARRSHAISRGC